MWHRDPSVERVVKKLRKLERNYRRDPAMNQYLGKTMLFPVIGPSEAGKTTLMHHVVHLDPMYAQVRTLTTRDPRPGEKVGEPYTFLPHAPEALRMIHKMAQHGEFVQFRVHPANGRIYATTPMSYSASALLDTLYDGLPDLEAIPFKAVRPSFVVCPPDEHRKRIAEQAQTTDPQETQKRVQEGIRSISWGLENRPDACWIVNGGRPPEETATEFIMRHEYPDPMRDERLNAAARDVGFAMLQGMQNML